VDAASLALAPMTLHSLHPARAHGVVDETPIEEAFRACYAARFAPLFSYLDRLTGDPDLAADVAQEAFVRLHRRGEMPDQPAGWLVAVANNLVRDERRRVTRQLRLLTEEPSRAPVGSAATDPVDDVERAERITAVRAALDRLSLRDRQALLLRHGGYSYREIAAALGLAETSVGTTLVRASHAFRAAFEEMHDASE
jgi:RNA polymerase sigma-70 factor (ECF subfamily)